MKIALTNMDIIWEDKSVNRDKCLALIKRASFCGARLLLFPEMTLTGFTMNPEVFGEKSGLDSETVSFFLEMSKQFEMAVGFGYIEKGTMPGDAKNHFAVVDKGQLLGDYVKIHPFSYGEENKHYCGGNQLVHVNIDELTLGLFICYDLRFPEIFQAMRSTCQAMAVIANWPKNRRMHWDILLAARAVETQTDVLGVNRKGKAPGLTYEVSSQALDWNGEILSTSKEKTSFGDECLIMEMDINALQQWRQQFPAEKDRKPDFYKSLLTT